MESIKDRIKEAIKLKQVILKSDGLLSNINKTVTVLIECFKQKNKLLLCGNGGSAADAQHLAAEFTGGFYLDRTPLFAEALHVNTSYLTAVANDYSYDEVYSRLVKGKGKKGDILIGMSTSGNSDNIVKALEEAKKIGLITIALTGESGGNAREFSDILINIPSNDTPRIQECHIMIGHIICELVEYELFQNVK